MVDPQTRQSWWQTLPGILTATATLITAVGGLVAVLIQVGVIGGKDRTADATHNKPAVVSDKPQSPGVSGDLKTTQGQALKPWAESEAVITRKDNVATTIRAETLSNCISVNHALTLGSGQEIPFEKMRSFEVVDSDPQSAALVITLLDGKTFKDRLNAACDLFGYNALGRYSTRFQELGRVDFRR
jgi:hypothetical protein